MIDVSIVIVNYKSEEELLNCLASIYKSVKKINFEVIVVDNSEKKTIGAKLGKRFEKVKYLKPNKNIGFGKGNNLGAKKAQGEFLFFVNPDTEFLPATLDKLIFFAKREKDVGAISPLLVNDQNAPQKIVGSQILTPIRAIFSLSIVNRIFPNNPISESFFLRNWDMKKPLVVDVFPGTAFLIKKDIFEKVGYFDEKFFLFFEESDLAQRIKKIGLKNFIIPDAKIKHLGRASTKKRDDIDKIYRKSQFYYFKKWYGFASALIVTFATSVGKNAFILLGITFLSLFLRTYKLNELMVFIGDQGWFYLSARDILIGVNIPLVGITSSHTWLHQGPYYTYIIALLFKFSNFNPLTPAYFSAFLGTISVLLVYRIASGIFTKRVGFISSLLYATSPLIVINDRFAYHTSPIPFFTILFIFSLYKWVRGNTLFFPITIFLLSVLYNFELATFSLSATFLLIFIFGLLKNKKWARGTANLRIFIFSSFAFLVPMAPIIIYDISHGFPQTLGFGAWVSYRLISFPQRLLNGNFLDGWDVSIINFLFQSFSNIILPYSYISSTLLIFSLIYVLIKIIKKTLSPAHLILFVIFFLSFVGIVLNNTSSDAYLPIFFPFMILILALFLDKLLDRKFLYSGLLFVIFLLVTNINFLISKNFSFRQNLTYLTRIDAVTQIIEKSKNKPYNLVGVGPGSEFSSFTMNYEYLLWYKNHSPSRNKEKLKIFITELNNGIIVTSND